MWYVWVRGRARPVLHRRDEPLPRRKHRGCLPSSTCSRTAKNKPFATGRRDDDDRCLHGAAQPSKPALGGSEVWSGSAARTRFDPLLRVMQFFEHSRSNQEHDGAEELLRAGGLVPREKEWSVPGLPGIQNTRGQDDGSESEPQGTVQAWARQDPPPHSREGSSSRGSGASPSQGSAQEDGRAPRGSASGPSRSSPPVGSAPHEGSPSSSSCGSSPSGRQGDVRGGGRLAPSAPPPSSLGAPPDDARDASAVRGDGVRGASPRPSSASPLDTSAACHGPDHRCGGSASQAQLSPSSAQPTRLQP
jgi:hypothetical protein